MKLLMKEAFAIILLSLVGNGLAQDDGFQYFERPSEIWNAKVAPVGSGNAVQISPDATIVYVTSANGTLTGLDATDGSVKFSYNPPSVDGAMIGCQSGVSFYDGNDGTFAVYSVVDELGAAPNSRVIAVSHPSGEAMWISRSFEGVGVGSPQISSDGNYVFFNHNAEGESVGHFTVIGNSMNESVVLYSTQIRSNPFAPLGIYHNPAEGFYKIDVSNPGNNTNDLLLWSHRLKLQAQTVVNGEGATFAFQIPMGYVPGTAFTGKVTELGTKNWLADAAPAIGNEGRTCYYGVSRNEFRGWIGESGSPSTRFHRTANAKLEINRRGTPRFKAPQHTPTFMNDGSMLFASFATPTMAALVPPSDPTTDREMTIRWEIDTESDISSRAIVSKDDLYVYFTEEDGVVHAASTTSTTPVLLWSMSLETKTRSEFSMDRNKDTLYLADVAGNVVAWKVAGAPTEAPTSALSSVEPSLAPSARPVTPMPTPSPSLPSVLPPTLVPTVSPTLAQPVSFPSTPNPTPTSNAFQLPIAVSSLGIAIVISFIFL